MYKLKKKQTREKGLGTMKLFIIAKKVKPEVISALLFIERMDCGSFPLVQ